MSMSGRAHARQRVLRWIGLAALVLVLLALIFLAGGHWVLGIVFAAAGAAAVWAFLQARTVR
jgi:hypothetical protein